MGGKNLTYDWPVSTPTADLTTSKLHWNIFLSEPGGKYLIVEVNEIYLKNTINKNEYDKTAIKITPQEIKDKYDLNNNQSDSYVCVIFIKVIYGLVQADIIAHKVLKENLKPYGYAPSIITQGFWTHQDRMIKFTLVVEYFGIKYRNNKDTDHLIAAFQEKYEVTQYWTGGI